jgi:predicted ATPase
MPQLATLGRLEMEGVPLAGTGQRTLLAYLALEGPKTRAHLARTFWPGNDRALKNLTMAVARLRRALPAEIVVDEETVDAVVATDVEDLLAALAARDADGALELYGGPFLAGVDGPMGIELEEWLFRTREWLATRLRTVVIEEAERRAAQGRFDVAVAYAERLVRITDDSTSSIEELARLHTLLRAGDSAFVREAVGDEPLGLDVPTWGTPTAAREALRRGLAIPTNVATGAGPFVGRTHDVAEVEALIDQERLVTLVGPAGVGKSRLATEVARRALASSRFRDGVFLLELAPLRAAAHVEDAVGRLVGVGGDLGGSAPQRLRDRLREARMLFVLDNFEHLLAAVSVVEDLLAAGEHIVVLATSRAPLRVAPERIHAVRPLGLPGPATIHDPLELMRHGAVALFAELGRRQVDGFRVTADNAAAVAALCRRLDGLPLALELAAARLGLFTPEELAARLAAGIEVLAQGRRDAPSRHWTLHAAIAWSYDLLTPAEQSAFRRLSTFVGDFSLAAAADLLAPNAPSAAVASDEGAMRLAEVTVSALVDQQLVAPTWAGGATSRYRMLETVRAFAAESSAERGEAVALERRHAEVFLALAERAAPHLAGSDQATWLARLDADRENLRAALAWTVRAGAQDLALRLGAASWRYWVVRGALREGRETLERILAGAPPEHPTAERASVLKGLGTLVFEMGEFNGARSNLEASLALWRSMGRDDEVAALLNDLGWITLQVGDLRRGRQLSLEAFGMHRSRHDQRGEAVALTNLGNHALTKGRFDGAAHAFVAALALRRREGNPRSIAYSLANLAWAQRCQGAYDAATDAIAEAVPLLERLGDQQLLGWTRWQEANVALDTMALPRAEEAAAESLRLHREVENGEGVALALTTLAEVLAERGAWAFAEARLIEAAGTWDHVPFVWGHALTEWSRARVAHALGEPIRALHHLRRCHAMRRRFGDQSGLAACLEVATLMNLPENPPDRAVRALALADALRTRTPAPLAPRFVQAIEAARRTLRSQVGDAAYEHAWKVGAEVAADPKQAFAFELTPA